MVNFKVLLSVCLVIVGVCGLESGVKIDPQPLPTGPSIPPEPSTTIKPTTPPPTTPSTTTTVTTPKTTTTPPTPPPNSTTTSTTTVKPTTPTPKPTPKPTPAPVNPKVANWTVNYDNSNRSCIILFVAAQFEIIEADSNKTIKVNVPVDATGSGTCEGKNGTQTLTVSWGQKNSLDLTFEKTNTSKFDLQNIVSTLNVSSETGNKVYILYHRKTEFSTPLENSYKCGHQQTLNLTEENGNITTAYLHVSHLQYQAFRNSTEHKFDSALDCDSSVTPDVVPIVVGCVLAALVVAVLAAYLFGRRRCQARGYLSMFEETRTEADYIPMKNLSCFN